MKKTLLIISIITFIIVGCKKFDEIEASKVEIVEENIEKGWDYIKINVQYDYPVELEAVTLYLSEKEDMSGSETYECGLKGKEIIIYITDVKDNTQYHYQFEYDDGYQKTKSEKKSIKTFIVPFVVTTSDVINIKPTSAQCGGNIVKNISVDIIKRGICWATTSNPTINDNVVNDNYESDSFRLNIIGLTDNIRYYVRAYAFSSEDTIYGEEKSFTTVEIVKPTVITNNITNITPTTGTLNGEVTFEGNAIVTAKGFCWDTSPEPTLDDNYSTNGSGIGGFTHALTDLPDNTTYYVRAYATNEKGTAYGEEKSFTTVEVVLPAVVTNDITDITTNSAKCSGTVTSDGNSAILAKGVCWSTSPEPTLNNNYTDEGDGSGAFISSLTNLTDGVKYYVRAYATNEKGTAYGEEKSFTTVEITLPIVTTKEVSNITTNSATCGGNVTSDGNGIITARGVCWSASPNPTIEDNQTTYGSGLGSFVSYITDLAPNTQYYVRAYATNEKGTAYGEEKQITTLPAITINEITDITINSAKCYGNVISGGNGIITAKGVCWSTFPEPTLDDNYTDEGEGNGTFISNLNNLVDNTTYYVRAYATNEEGTNYSEEKEFTTLIFVETSIVTEITTCSAICGGNVLLGGADSDVLECGICWSTSPNPTLYDEHTLDGSSFGSYVSTLEDLNDNTTYYVRAYVTNCSGISYGISKSFTTKSATGFVNGYEWVDLGLPSGLKWATCNVGASSPDSYGEYYPSEQASAADDKWGEMWRLPSITELEELMDNCTWIWTTINGVNGYKVVGANEKYIFLPATGYKYYDFIYSYWGWHSFGEEGECGAYWSSTYCYAMRFYDEYQEIVYFEALNSLKRYACYVRLVTD